MSVSGTHKPAVDLPTASPRSEPRVAPGPGEPARFAEIVARRRPDPRDILALQRLAGNRGVLSLLQRPSLQRQAVDAEDAAATPDAAPAVAPAPRTPVARGASGPEVGVLQQKLNGAGGTPALVIDARFGGRTQSAVRRFQRTHDLPVTGEADAATWAALDALVPGGEIAADGTITRVEGPVEGNPTGRPLAGTSIHPTVRLGAVGPGLDTAIRELKQKLTGLGIAVLPDTGVFDADTDTAVRAFQRRERLGVDGIAGRRTWARLDALGVGSTVGRVERQWEERVEGMTYAMNAGNGATSRYSWELHPDRMVVTVNYAFTGAVAGAPIATWLGFIGTRWNTFKAEKVVPPGTPPESLNIDFNPQQANPPDQTVNVIVDPPGNPGRSDATNWHTSDPDMNGMVGHEFGHHIGLEDEYRREPHDIVRLTGTQPAVGDVDAPGSPDPAQVARDIRQALLSNPAASRGATTAGVVTGHGLTQGAYSQLVDQNYRGLFGIAVVRDIHNRIPKDAQGSITGSEITCVNPFLYTMTDNIMGSGSHSHSAEPRHVREFVGYVQANKGGIWRPARR